MIRFSCICAQLYEATDEQAGTSFQCPACGRLVDVPTLSELPSISADGTYKMDADPVARTPEQQLKRVSELQRAYTRHRTDQYGREIDLRPTPQEIKDAGADDVPLEMADEVRPAAPRYDPITGELIRPLDIKDDAPKSTGAIPWITPAVGYGSDNLPFRAWQIIPELFRLQNVAVMFGVFLIHFILQLMLFPMTLKFLILIPFFLVLMGGLFSHYANVVEAVGPDHADELPRPLRDLQPMEDIWSPFIRFMLSLILAYGVAITAIYLPIKARGPVLVAVALFGSIVLPALLLTATTSGSITNLRPDRVMRVMRACGAAYLLLVIGWIVGSCLYMAAFLATCLTFLHFFDRDGVFPYDWYLHPVITYPALLLAILLMHALMWYLGLQYRYHYDEFNWSLQVHQRDENLPPKRGFEIERGAYARQRTRAAPIAAQPVLPIPAEPVLEETDAQVQARRRRLLQQAREAEEAKQRGQSRPKRPADDDFDIDELLKP